MFLNVSFCPFLLKKRQKSFLDYQNSWRIIFLKAFNAIFIELLSIIWWQQVCFLQPHILDLMCVLWSNPVPSRFTYNKRTCSLWPHHLNMCLNVCMSVWLGLVWGWPCTQHHVEEDGEKVVHRPQEVLLQQRLNLLSDLLKGELDHLQLVWRGEGCAANKRGNLI